MWSSPRSISTHLLNGSLHLHIVPINLVVYKGSYLIESVGYLIFGSASRLSLIHICKRDARLWNLACDIAVENVLDSLNRFSVKRPLTWVRQNAYAAIAAEGRVVAAAPAYRWLAGQTPGILRQLEREFYTDDHRLWPKDAPEQPQQMPTPLPLSLIHI